MPEVDGLQATKMIRAFEKEQHEKKFAEFPKEIPIIAMTANVFKEDIQKCTEAGMNDHLGKPIVMDDVMRVLSRYLKTT